MRSNPINTRIARRASPVFHSFFTGSSGLHLPRSAFEPAHHPTPSRPGAESAASRTVADHAPLASSLHLISDQVSLISAVAIYLQGEIVLSFARAALPLFFAFSACLFLLPSRSLAQESPTDRFISLTFRRGHHHCRQTSGLSFLPDRERRAQIASGLCG